MTDVVDNSTATRPEPVEQRAMQGQKPPPEPYSAYSAYSALPRSAPTRSEHAPTINPDIYHGLTGEYVATLAPETESDPLAVLVQTLAWCGARIGTSTGFQFGSETIRPQVWPLLIGRTSTGRKGTSESESIRRFAAMSDVPRIESGMTSGEGLIDYLARPADDAEPRDYRVLVVESEWDGVLARLRREGNTLSAVIRDAYDGRRLSTMNSNGNHRSATDYNLTIVGHITPPAFQAMMTASGISNGFLNRFQVVEVHRPHLKLWPSEPDMVTVDLAAKVVRASSDTARMNTRPGITEAAKARYQNWYQTHADSSERMPERVAMATGRAPNTVLRVALLLASIDHSNVIDTAHVAAGIALADYSIKSSRRLLAPQRTQDGKRILDALAKQPLTKDQVRDLFQRNRPAAELNELLVELEGEGLLTSFKDTTGHGRAPIVYSLPTAERGNAEYAEYAEYATCESCWQSASIPNTECRNHGAA